MRLLDPEGRPFKNELGVVQMHAHLLNGIGKPAERVQGSGQMLSVARDAPRGRWKDAPLPMAKWEELRIKEGSDMHHGNDCHHHGARSLLG